MGSVKLVEHKLDLQSAEPALGYVAGNLMPWVAISLQLNAFSVATTTVDPRSGVSILRKVVDDYVEMLSAEAAAKIKSGHFL